MVRNLEHRIGMGGGKAKAHIGYKAVNGPQNVPVHQETWICSSLMMPAPG